MKDIYPRYYKDFHCIADKCEDSCCAGWEIDIDDESYDVYMSMEGGFGDRLRSYIKTYGDDVADRYEKHGFILTDDMRCPLLREDGLCDLIIKKGDKNLCEVCTHTPRTYMEYGGIREISLSASCPEVARLIYASDTPISYICIQSDENPSYQETDDEIIYSDFIRRAKDTAIEILQKRELKLKDRVRAFIIYANDIQRAIITYEDDERLLSDVDVTSLKKKAYEALSQTSDDEKEDKRFDRYISDGDTKYRQFLKRMVIYSGLASIGEGWKTHIESVYETFIINADEKKYEGAIADLMEYMHHEGRVYEYEHILVYYAYLLLPRSVDDHDFLTKAGLVIISYLMVRDMDVSTYISKGILSRDDRILHTGIYAREVEHSDENLADLEEELLFA